MYNGRLYDSLLVRRQTKKDYAEKKIKPQEILGPPETQHEHPPQFIAAEIQRPKEILAQGPQEIAPEIRSEGVTQSRTQHARDEARQAPLRSLGQEGDKP
jgi:hypothetical protein